MSTPENRSGFINALLAGVVLLLTVAGGYIALVPCVECQQSRHHWVLNKPSDRICSLCGGGNHANRVTLWKKWFGKPGPEDWR